MTRSQAGFTLIELLCVVALLGLMASLPLVTSGSDRDRLQLDAAARRLLLGLERARSVARREQMACGIALSVMPGVLLSAEALPGGCRPALACLWRCRRSSTRDRSSCTPTCLPSCACRPTDCCWMAAPPCSAMGAWITPVVWW